jgi:hypothetical protein
MENKYYVFEEANGELTQISFKLNGDESLNTFMESFITINEGKKIVVMQVIQYKPKEK